MIVCQLPVAGGAADARLIAAAPELLEALYTALPFIEDAERDPAFKPGVVARQAREIRALLKRIGG